ncbi:molybdenum cofactor guanylyltransferase [Pedobacter caeni]|uniref:Molybdopterin-guanine dinucleotide biosynthesis protein A n=1 Tax=Pedobacter caeni TaxID=288992 RepID=A0A1M4U243_9SPHI|nr:molybdenum cofactor guanylyltransferase [Pedobacter caeni]SHE50753.1 molybdopterin-guanine dinucleotide biosynthesis protein A [Pedobacter caeni]
MIRAVVLCGGESKRMGSDKGLLWHASGNWVTLASSKFEKLNIPVSISINPAQLQTYRDFFSSEQLIIDQTNAKGPLQGLLSTHLKHPEDDLLLLACDMTEMDSETLKFLLDSTLAAPGFDYYVYVLKDFIEPLCAIYSSISLKKLQQSLEQGSLTVFSLHKIIKKGNYKTVPIHKPESFNNHNTTTIKLPV